MVSIEIFLFFSFKRVDEYFVSMRIKENKDRVILSLVNENNLKERVKE